jgi:hypothetical protein
MPSDDPSHCGEPMRLARLIPKFEVLPELLVFKCERCAHVETIAQAADKSADGAGASNSIEV